MVRAVLIGKCVGKLHILTPISEALVEELLILIVEVDDVVDVEQSSSSTVNFKIGLNTWRCKG